jgi:DNA-binding beta-propeller fold protein YncE
VEDQELVTVEREVRARLAAQLDRVPVRSGPNFTPVQRRWPLALKVSMSTVTIALTLVLAIGIGQGLRSLRDRAAASQAPEISTAPGALTVIPPHLASPDSIVVLYDPRPVTLRGPNQAPVANVAVIDSQTGALRYSVPVGEHVRAVVRAAGAELIVIDWPNDSAQRIQFVDARTGTITGTMTDARPRPTLGKWPEIGAAVSPDGKLLVVQRLAGAAGFGSPTVPALVDDLAFYDLDQRTRIGSLSTPGCGPGQVGFTDDGRHLFLVCSNTGFYVIDAGTRTAVATGALPQQGLFPPPGPEFGGMTVIGSTATVVSTNGQTRFVIRTDGSISSMNLGQLFSDAQAVPAGALVRVPRQGRVFVGYGPAGQGMVVDARIMDEGSSGGRFSITRESVGGLLADDRGNLFGAAADGSIWRRGSTTVSDDVTLVNAVAGRSARLLATLRVMPPAVLSRDQAIRLMNAPNIRVDRVDRVEAKLVTLNDALPMITTPVDYLNGVDRSTPVWVVALRGEMHAIRGLIDIDATSAQFVLDAQTGQSIAFFSSRLDWPNGFDALADRAPAASGPTTSPRLPVIGGVAPIGDVAARVTCDGKLGTARLVAAFDSTAGVVADWTENVAFADAPHPPSPWRQLPASARAYVCYYDGQFASPGGPVGASVPPLAGRALILVDASGAVLGSSKYGPAESLPLNRPGGRF